MRPKLVALAATVAALLGAGGFLASTSCGCRGIDVSHSPQITGTLGSGNALTASNGTWTSVPVQFTYQWVRCDQTGINCRPIPGASTGVYVQADGDGGSTLAVIVTATNDVGQTTSAQSGPTALIPGLIPVNTTLPAVSGDAFWASTNLTASPGAWTNSPTTFTYQWQDCNPGCSNIAGATGQSYIPTQTDVGATLQVAVTAWNTAGPASAASTATAAVGANGPPPITLSGQTISWPAQPGATSFRGAYSTAPAGGQVTYFPSVTNPWTPTAQCGQTLYYDVASEGPAGEWFGSTRLPITWPACAGGGKLEAGVMNIGTYNYPPLSSAPIFQGAGVTYTREETGGGANTGTCNSTDYVCTALQYGVVPLAVFEDYAASNMTSEIVSLAQHLNTLAQTYPIMNKMHVIEFGNEVWEGTSGGAVSAATYGSEYDAAHQALANAGLGSWRLLAAGTAICSDNRGANQSNWIPGVIAQMSGGASEIDGWTIHPYGPMTTDAGCGGNNHNGYGWPAVKDWHDIAVNAGSNAPWYVTEVGQCLGGSGCNAVPQGACSDAYGTNTQAGDMRTYLTDLAGDTRTGATAKYPWVAAFIWYQVYDDSSGWFGVLGNGIDFGDPVDNQRPAFCELKNWIAANGEG